MACFECGSCDRLHNHHVVPRSRGGTKTVLLCYRCHARAHGKSGNFDIGTLTKAALAYKKAQGEFCGGQAPYGYRVAADGVSLVEDEIEQGVISAIVTYRQDGLSLRAIVAKLDEAGVVGRAGRPLQLTAVTRILGAVP